MTGEQIFILVLLYSLGFLGSMFLLWIYQGGAFGKSWYMWAMIASSWPLNVLLLPISIGILVLCIIASGEWKEIRK